MYTTNQYKTSAMKGSRPTPKGKALGVHLYKIGDHVYMASWYVAGTIFYK